MLLGLLALTALLLGCSPSSPGTAQSPADSTDPGASADSTDPGASAAPADPAPADPEEDPADPSASIDTSPSSPCPEPASCDAGYRQFLSRARSRGTPTTKAELDRQLPLLLDAHPIRPSAGPSNEALRAQLLDAAGIGWLVAEQAAKPVAVSVIADTKKTHSRELILRFDDPWVGSFSALLLLPLEPGTHPAVVVHPGHGESIREHLARRFGAGLPRAGFAVLVLEPRMHAGDPPAAALTLDLLLEGHTLVGLRAYEAMRALSYLASRSDIDGDRIAFGGHSGGALVGNLVVRVEPRFSALITDLVSNYLNVDEQGGWLDECAPELTPLRDLISNWESLEIPMIELPYGYPDGEAPVLSFLRQLAPTREPQLEETTPPVPEVPPDLQPPARAGRCYVDQALMAAGTYPVGTDQPSEGKWALPASTVDLPAWCIDRYEFPNRKGETPLTQTTWQRSKEFCAAVGKRLCTDAEWMAACRGKEGRSWAYGDTRVVGACHSDLDGWGEYGVWSIKASGSHPDCRTPEGVYDLTGNASEWVDSLYEGSDHVDVTGVDYPDGLPRPLLRGGTPWPSSYGQSCLARHWHAVGFDQGDGDGFRCCSDAR